MHRKTAIGVIAAGCLTLAAAFGYMVGFYGGAEEALAPTYMGPQRIIDLQVELEPDEELPLTITKACEWKIEHSDEKPVSWTEVDPAHGYVPPPPRLCTCDQIDAAEARLKFCEAQLNGVIETCARAMLEKLAIVDEPASR